MVVGEGGIDTQPEPSQYSSFEIEVLKRIVPAIAGLQAAEVLPIFKLVITATSATKALTPNPPLLTWFMVLAFMGGVAFAAGGAAVGPVQA